MKYTIFAATAAAVVALGATFAGAQTDQNNPRAGDRHARPEAAQTQAAQPAQHQQTMPTQGMRQTPPAPPSSPGMAQQPNRQSNATTGREEGRETSRFQANTPNTQTQPRLSTRGEERGELSQTRPAMTPNAQPQRNLPQNAQTRQGTSTSAERFGENRGVWNDQRPEFNERFGAEQRDRFGAERFGGDRFGTERFGAEQRERFGADRFGTERFGAERFGTERFERPGFQVTERQRTELRERLAAAPLHRIARFGFSVAVGAIVPHTVAMYPLPPTMVSVVPQFRGYRYVADNDRIVIVEPHTYRVAAVLPMGELGYGSSMPPRISGCR